MSKSLTISERAEYNTRKKRVKQWCGDRFQIGEDLLAIRDKKLYADDYATFEECCEAEFGLKKSQSYRLMDATEVKSSLGTSPIGGQITNERQARVLLDVPKKQRLKVIKEASKTGSVTAQSLGKAKEKLLAPPEDEPEEVLDASGYPVPAPALEIWGRREEAKKYVQLISEARSAVRNLISEQEASPKQDILYVEVNLKSVLAELSNAYTEMNLAVPRLVCGVCQGQTPKTCMLCKGRGVISKNKWDLCVPLEIKEIRKKHSRK